MLITVILTLIMCVPLFLIIWSAAFFLPWKGLMDFFSEDIKEKAIDHKPPFKTAPVFGWICMILCMRLHRRVVYGGLDGTQRGYTFGQFLVRFLTKVIYAVLIAISMEQYSFLAGCGESWGHALMCLAFWKAYRNYRSE